MELEQGIVLKTIDYQENSKIIYILTNDGIKSAIVRGAKNIKSHTYSYAQPLVKIEFEIKKDRYIGANKIVNNYNNIKLNFDKLSSCLKIIEICYTLGEHITDSKLFYQFTCDIFDIINNVKNYHQIYELIFKIKILYLLGVAPVFTKCVTCGKSEHLVGFAFNYGGMKCSNCMQIDEFIYPNDTIKQIRDIYLIKLEKLNLLIENDGFSYCYDKISRFLDLYYEQYLGFVSKVNKVLK